jgi:YegS/Rv2252/BmrU family lipid kinase
VTVNLTERRGHAAELAEAAAKSGAQIIVAVGGDGTLSEVVDGVIRSGVVDEEGHPAPMIAVLPLGTASDFHKTMCWPIRDIVDFEASILRIGRGAVALMDVCKLTCQSPSGELVRHFVNIGSCGVTAEAAWRADRWRWLGSKLSYRLAEAAALYKYRRRAVAVRVDGGEWVQFPSATLVAAGSGRYFGNGLKVCPGADPFTGKLQIVIANNLGLSDFVKNLKLLEEGEHLNLPGFTSFDAKKVEVVPLGNVGMDPTDPASHGGEQLLVEADGEVFGWGPFTVEKLPRTIKFIV